MMQVVGRQSSVVGRGLYSRFLTGPLARFGMTVRWGTGTLKARDRGAEEWFQQRGDLGRVHEFSIVDGGLEIGEPASRPLAHELSCFVATATCRTVRPELKIMGSSS